MTIPVALRQLADAIEAEQSAAAPEPTEPPFYDRRPEWLEERAYRRALVELARECKVFRPGRRLLVKPADLRAWCERFSVARVTKTAEEDQDAPIDFAGFRSRRAAR